MNKRIASIGALIVTITVLLFAVCMLISFDFGSYFVCMLLPIGYIMMISGFCNESAEKCKVAANVGMIFAAVYFCYDLLGYGMMALSTFFIGLTIDTKTKSDKWLKYLMLIHGAFFFSCFIMPMTGIFSSKSSGESITGVIALEFWCAYFIPIGILSFRHFKKSNK